MALIMPPRNGLFGRVKWALEFGHHPKARHGEAFHYTPLPNDFNAPEIRLVKLLPDSSDSPVRCELHRTILRPANDTEDVRSSLESQNETWDYVRYDALSYVWGDPSNTRSITVDGKEFKVTKNLYLALKRLRKSSLENDWQGLFWIDAICIDQRNLQERSQQVQLMAKIYSMAQQVVVWLGEENEESQVAFEILNLSQFNHYQSNWEYRDRQWDEFNRLEAIKSTFRDRPWWKRLWVVQEICHAQTIHLQCGSMGLEWDKLCELYKSYGNWNENLNAIGAGARLHKALEEVWAMETWRINSKESEGQEVGGPEEVRNEVRNLAVETFGRRHCSDPRDSIYGLLSISPLLASVVPDYSLSTADVYIAAAKAIISFRQDLDILSRVQRSNSIQAQKLRDEKILPSWVPDWAIKMEYADILSLAPKDAPFRASGDTKLSSNTVSEYDRRVVLDDLVGIHWDEIMDLSELHYKGHLGTGFDGDGGKGAGMVRFMDAISGSETGLRGWSGFTTNTGAKGLVLGSVEIGDMIYIVYGSRVPLILRPVGNRPWSTFSLTGTAYVEEIMDGQVVETMRHEYYGLVPKGSWLPKSLFKSAHERTKRGLVVKTLVNEKIRLV